MPNSEFRAGLESWHSFIMEWNGVSTLYKHTNSKYGGMRLVLGDVPQSTTNSGFKSVGLIIQSFKMSSKGAATYLGGSCCVGQPMVKKHGMIPL